MHRGWDIGENNTDTDLHCPPDTYRPIPASANQPVVIVAPPPVYYTLILHALVCKRTLSQLVGNVLIGWLGRIDETNVNAG